MHDIFKDALRPFAPKGSTVHLNDNGSQTAEKVTPASAQHDAHANDWRWHLYRELRRGALAAELKEREIT